MMKGMSGDLLGWSTNTATKRLSLYSELDRSELMAQQSTSGRSTSMFPLGDGFFSSGLLTVYEGALLCLVWKRRCL